MLLESAAAKAGLPVVVKVAISAGQLVFAGCFLAFGFQIGHTTCRKAIEWWDHRTLAKIEQAVEEPDDGTGSVSDDVSK